MILFALGRPRVDGLLAHHDFNAYQHCLSLITLRSPLGTSWFQCLSTLLVTCDSRITFRIIFHTLACSSTFQIIVWISHLWFLSFEIDLWNVVFSSCYVRYCHLKLILCILKCSLSLSSKETKQNKFVIVVF